MISPEPFGVYVHWPFCLSKCPYCDFNSHVRHAPVDEERFVRAFAREIETTAQRAGQPLPIPVCAYIMAEMLNGLDYAHRKRDASGRPLNIVHRDISPQNVVVSQAGEVKLVEGKKKAG